MRRWRWVVLIIGLGVALSLGGFGYNPADTAELAQLIAGAALTPAASWLLLTWLAREAERRTSQQELQEIRRRFMHDLAQCSEWEDVAQFLVRAPAAWWPVEQATLYIFDVAAMRLCPAQTWRRDAGVPAVIQHERLCLTCRLPRLRHVSHCEYQSLAPSSRVWDDHCVPLAHDSLLVGLLRLGCPAGQPLPGEVQDLLTSLAPEMTLALVRGWGQRGQMAQARTAAQTYERREIAQMLHNSLAHQVGYLHLSLEQLAGDDRVQAWADIADEIQHMRDVSGEAYDRIRDTLAFLRSQEQADLTGAIAELVRTAAREAGLEVVVTSQGEPRPLPPQMSHKVFRLMQEGVNNAVKHARARRAELQLGWQSDGLELCVADDGVGFAPAAVAPDGHYGLAMLRETVNDLGGRLQIESAPGRGTRLVFTVPLTASAA